MAKLIYGERIGKAARLRVGCSALIWDETGQKILLTRRADNGRWCMPGGGMKPGECAAEACEREVLEETGLQTRVVKLIGIYTTPHRITEYADGNQYQFVSLHFEVEVTGGALRLSDETTDYGYFTLAEIETIDVMDHHRERIVDSAAKETATFVR
jgi:ADP-ribose pyrophosphatase YjhB (NUDIX family)